VFAPFPPPRRRPLTPVPSGVQRAAGVFVPLLSAGDAIYGGQYRCSLGFNVVSGSTYYFLTAGYCGKVANTWYTNASHTTLIGPTIAYSFPGNDYALVRYDNTALSQPAGYTAANAYVGEPVKRTGSTTGTHSGTVTALNVKVATTVELPAGTTVADIAEVSVQRVVVGTDTGAPVHVTAIKRGFALAENYLPQQSFLSWTGDVVLDSTTTSAVLWHR
jgi:streptogrisin B